MATIHDLSALAYKWSALDPDNVTAEVELADLGALSILQLYGAVKLDSQYFAVFWRDSDQDLQLGVYDRVNASFDYVEVTNNSGAQRGRIDRVSDTKIAVYYNDATVGDWILATYTHSGGTVSASPDASLAVSSATPAQSSLHSMCVLSETRLIASIVTSGSPYQITFKGFTIGSGTLTVDAGSAANTSSINNSNSVSLAKYSSTRAAVYHAGGGASNTSLNLVIDGSPITFGTGANVNGVSGAFYANCFPAISDDGSFAILPYNPDSLSSTYSFVSGASISGTTITGGGSGLTSSTPNLPNSDAGTPTGGTAAVGCYLAKEGDFHMGAVMGNYKDPLRNRIWGLIVGFKAVDKMIMGGTFHLPSGASNIFPFLFRQDAGTLTAVYSNASGNPSFINVSRSPL